MQKNAVCHNGGPIHLADYPLDPDAAEFKDHEPDTAHRWAMEGVKAYGARCN
jgi:hypothetical protein